MGNTSLPVTQTRHENGSGTSQVSYWIYADKSGSCPARSSAKTTYYGVSPGITIILWSWLSRYIEIDLHASVTLSPGIPKKNAQLATDECALL